MSSKIWPPPTTEEQAILDVEEANPFHEECEDCECYPCRCDWCSECRCEDCECETCEMCGLTECECPEVYVYFATRVIVTVDCDGDVSYVRVVEDLEDAYEVEYENGYTVPLGPLRDRALTAVRNQDWPGWNIE